MTTLIRGNLLLAIPIVGWAAIIALQFLEFLPEPQFAIQAFILGWAAGFPGLTAYIVYFNVNLAGIPEPKRSKKIIEMSLKCPLLAATSNVPLLAALFYLETGRLGDSEVGLAVFFSCCVLIFGYLFVLGALPILRMWLDGDDEGCQVKNAT